MCRKKYTRGFDIKHSSSRPIYLECLPLLPRVFFSCDYIRDLMDSNERPHGSE